VLIRICQQRYRGFAEAAEAVLDALAEVVPGVVVLSQVDPDAQVCRVIGVQGVGVDGLQRGTVLPLSSRSDGDATAAGPGPYEIDGDLLDSLGVEGRIGIPLEMSDGQIVGVLFALDSRADAYRSKHVAMLGVAGRLLSYEWESVERRAELRRLRARLPESANVDSETGLLNRDGFLGLLDHDWRLAERGTVESVVVAVRVEGDSRRGPDGDAVDKLALKIAAEVLAGNVRRTDRAARVGDSTLAVSLVGCAPEQAPVFVERFRAALERVTRSGYPRIGLSHGIRSLSGVSSAQEALSCAEAAIGAIERPEESPDPSPQAVTE